jgi:hypothetical protein
MRKIDSSYETIRHEALRLAAEYRQRVAPPHLVWAIIRTHYWPQSVPRGAEGFCEAVSQSLPAEVHSHSEATLYAQMVLERADDATSLIFHLFWSPWAQDEGFIRTWHQLGWAPPIKMPMTQDKPRRSTGPRDEAAEQRALARWQQSQVIDLRRREWPTRVVEILRGIDNASLRFICINAIDYSSFSLVEGTEWRVNPVANQLVAEPSIKHLDITSAAGEVLRVWDCMTYECMCNNQTQLQRTDYRFIGDAPFTLTESETLSAVTENGQRWPLRFLAPSVTD